jgi:hypothetical protein
MHESSDVTKRPWLRSLWIPLSKGFIKNGQMLLDDTEKKLGENKRMYRLEFGPPRAELDDGRNTFHPSNATRYSQQLCSGDRNQDVALIVLERDFFRKMCLWPDSSRNCPCRIGLLPCQRFRIRLTDATSFAFCFQKILNRTTGSS